MAQPRVVIMGHCTIDDIHQPDGTLLAQTPGGAAAYATVGAALFDVPVTLVTLIGQDYPIERLRGDLSMRGNVDMSAVRVQPRTSIHDVAWYGSDGSRRFDIEDWDALEELTPGVDDLPASGLEDAVVLLTPCSLSRQLQLIEHLRRYNCPVATDTELHYFPSAEARDLLRQVAHHASFFLPSVEHLQRVFDSRSSDPLEYQDQIMSLGCPWVSVKQGRAGSTLFDCSNNRHWHIPAIQNVEVQDTTGAGDAYCGGFVAALATCKTPLEAACYGTVAASFAVECVGARVPAHFDPLVAAQRYEPLYALARQSRGTGVR